MEYDTTLPEFHGDPYRCPEPLLYDFLSRFLDTVLVIAFEDWNLRNPCFLHVHMPRYVCLHMPAWGDYINTLLIR